MSNVLSSLKIDYWYKAVLVFGATLLVLSLTVPFHGVPNREVALLSSGLAIFGLGEWINHPLRTIIRQPDINYPGWLKCEGHPWKPSTLGIMLDIVGLALIGWAIYHLVLL